MISAKCITYGRVETLEESLHSFLRQNYNGEREMVIVNDYPSQKLEFDHPFVRIFNFDKTFNTIGEKENFAVSQCKGDIIAVWDDDDIAMDNHLSNIEKHFVNVDLMHWQTGVFYNQEVTAITGLGNSGIVYSKEIWERVGGHPIENAGYDTSFVNRIIAAGGRVTQISLPDNEVSWFYCWAGRSYHMSGMGADDNTKENVIKRHSDYIDTLRLENKIPVGNVKLRPHWNEKYDVQLKEFIKRNYGK